MLNNSALTSYDVRDYKIVPLEDLPESYICPIKVKVKNQLFSSTCVAYALSSILEYHYKKQHDGANISFSTEFLYGYRPEGYHQGEGMKLREALTTALKVGDCFTYQCSGNHNVEKASNKVNSNLAKYKELAKDHKITAYYSCPSEKEIKTALVKHGPVLTAMRFYEGSYLVNDIYTYDSNSKYGDHAVMIYGYDERGWLIQNSWGKLWGWDGKFILPYDFKLTASYGVTDDFVEEDLIVKNNSKFANFIYKVYNAVVNFILNLS